MNERLNILLLIIFLMIMFVSGCSKKVTTVFIDGMGKEYQKTGINPPAEHEYSYVMTMPTKFQAKRLANKYFLHRDGKTIIIPKDVWDAYFKKK